MQQWIENDRTGKYELVDELGIMYQALNIEVVDLVYKLDAKNIPEDLAEFIAGKFTEVAIA